MTKLLGIDIGTSSAKAVLVDSDTQQIIASAAQEYPIHRPAPDRAEQNPAEWWDAVVYAVRQITAEHADIAAVGFSGQMHGTVLLDKAGEVVHPAIIWADSRSTEQVAQLAASVNDYASITGTLPAVGFMGVTLMWLKQHAPDVLDRAHKVLLPKDYVHYRLTGEMTTEVTDAASTSLFDVQRGAWADDVLAAVDLPRALFPTVLPSHEPRSLTEEAADTLGLPPGIPVAAGCADQPAQALANGIISPGVVSVTVGSGGQVFAPLGAFRTDPRLHVFNHAVPNTYYALGAILSAGLSLRWLRDTLGMEAQTDAYAALSAEAADVPPGADGLIFLPYLSGERTPHMDAHARGGFIGLSGYHTRGHLARAVMEGVAFALRQALEITQELGGTVETVIGSGGGVESTVWRGILTDVFGVPVRKTLTTEQASIGAALLGGIGAGVYAGFDDAAQPQYDDATKPDRSQAAFYDARYEQFKQLYPKLKTDMHQLAGGDE